MQTGSKWLHQRKMAALKKMASRLYNRRKWRHVVQLVIWTMSTAGVARSLGAQELVYYIPLPVAFSYTCASVISYCCSAAALGQTDLAVFLCAAGCFAEKLPQLQFPVM